MNTTELKQRTDLLDLVGRDTTLRKVATTGGGEHAGACPFCGGTDRLRVQPERGLWWCRQCSGEHWQDAIAYVQKRHGIGFKEACDMLGGGDVPPSTNVRQPAPPPPLEPTDDWRQAAGSLVERCEAALWTDVGAKALTYLHKERGLTDETVKRWRLGYNPQDQAINGLHVRRGITIPWFVDGELWQIKVRLPVTSGTKYLAVKGGHPLLYGTDTLHERRVAVLCEGEFDTILLHQEVAHKLSHVGMVTLGSVSAGLSSGVIPYLLPIPRILVAYDMDDAGEKGAEKMMGMSARMKRIKVPLGKDVTDFYLQGGRLRDWVEWSLFRMNGWSQSEADKLLAETLNDCAALYVPGQGSEFHDSLDVLEQEVDKAMAERDSGNLRSATLAYKQYVTDYRYQGEPQP